MENKQQSTKRGDLSGKVKSMGRDKFQRAMNQNMGMERKRDTSKRGK